MTYYSRFKRSTSIFHSLFRFFFVFSSLHIQYILLNSYILLWNAVINVIYTARDHCSIYFHCINEIMKKKGKKCTVPRCINTRATRHGNVARLIVSIRRGVVERQFLLATRETFESLPRRRITHI